MTQSEKYNQIYQLFTLIHKKPDLIISPDNYIYEKGEVRVNTSKAHNSEKYYQGMCISDEKEYVESRNGLQVYDAGMVAYSILTGTNLVEMGKKEIVKLFGKDIFCEARIGVVESSFIEQCLVFNSEKNPHRRPTAERMLCHTMLEENLTFELKEMSNSRIGVYQRDKKKNSYIPIGKGANGCVYIVLKPIMLKTRMISYYVEKQVGMPSGNDKEAYEREIETNKKIREKKIKGCITSFQEKKNKTKDTIKIRMEYYKGKDLNELIEKYGVFSEKDTSEIMKQVVTAYAELHKLNIIYRDIKPSNILVGINSKGKFESYAIDFGSARALPGKKNMDLTMTGTLSTIAPEVIKREKYNFKADIFSVGATCYRLLVGSYIMNLTNPEDVPGIMEIYKKKNILIKASAKLSMAAIDLLDRCLKIDPKLRFASMDEVCKHDFFTPGSKSSLKIQTTDEYIDTLKLRAKEEEKKDSDNDD